MRKIQKILIGIFSGGVLLGGVGTGIALVEGSALAYGGEKMIGSENLVVRELEHTFDPQKGKIEIERNRMGYRNKKNLVETDEAVPENVIRYVVTYNEETARPYLEYCDFSDDENVTDDEPGEFGEAAGSDGAKEEETGADAQSDPIQGFLELNVDYYGSSASSDFALWMKCKDEVLSELKQRKISTYEVAYITDVKIKVNPETLKYIVDEGGRSN